MILLAAVVLAAQGVRPARADFGPPFYLDSAEPPGSKTVVAFDGDRWVSAWRGGSFEIFVSRSADGSDWEDPDSAPFEGEPVDLAADGRGGVLLAWYAYPPGTVGRTLFVASSSDHGATWTEPVEVVRGVSALPQAEIATDGEGTWLAVWSDSGNDSPYETDVFSSRSTDEGETWSTPETLNPWAEGDRMRDERPSVGADESGNFLVSWTSTDELSDEAAVWVRRSTTAGEDFDPPAAPFGTEPYPEYHGEFMDVGGLRSSQIESDGCGIWVLVRSWPPNLDGRVVKDDVRVEVMRSSDAGASWTGPEVLVADDSPSEKVLYREPGLAADGRGNWLVVWQAQRIERRGGGGFRQLGMEILAAHSSDDAVAWSAPFPIQSEEWVFLSRLPQLASDRRGNWTVLWGVEAEEGSGAMAAVGSFTPTHASCLAPERDCATSPPFREFPCLEWEAPFPGAPPRAVGPFPGGGSLFPRRCEPDPWCPHCSLSAREASQAPASEPRALFESLRAEALRGEMEPKGRTRALTPLLRKIPAGPNFTARRRDRLAAQLGRAPGERIRGPALSAAARALAAAELDRRLPRGEARGRVAEGPDRRVDLNGIVELRVPQVRSAGDVQLEVLSDVPALPPGYAYGWPPIHYALRFDGELGGVAPFRIGLATGGISRPRGAPWHVLEWDGKRFRNVTVGFDEERERALGTTRTLKSYVLAFPWARSIPEDECRRPASLWERVFGSLVPSRRDVLLLRATFEEDPLGHLPTEDLPGDPAGDAVVTDASHVIESPELESHALRLETAPGALVSARFVPARSGDHDAGRFRVGWTAFSPVSLDPIVIRVVSSSERVGVGLTLDDESFTVDASDGARTLGHTPSWTPHRIELEIDLDADAYSLWKDERLRISNEPLNDSGLEDLAALEFRVGEATPVAPPTGGGHPSQRAAEYVVDDVGIRRLR